MIRDLGELFHRNYPSQNIPTISLRIFFLNLGFAVRSSKMFKNIATLKTVATSPKDIYFTDKKSVK